MSDPATPPAATPSASVPIYPIDTPWLRDAVAAYNNSARATATYAGALGVLVVVCVSPGWDTGGIAASMAGVLGFFGSKDKRAAIDAAAK